MEGSLIFTVPLIIMAIKPCASFIISLGIYFYKQNKYQKALLVTLVMPLPHLL
jgi:hypothetical protein